MPKRKNSENKENQENSTHVEAKKSKKSIIVSIDSQQPTRSRSIIANISNEPIRMTNICEPSNQKISIEDELVLEEIKYQNSIDQIKTIKKIISNVNASGECSVGGEAVELPTTLGLHVKKIGHLSLPLCKQQAESLIKVCKQAPYGLKYDTVYDKSVRDSYQLDPSEIEIQNKAWNENLDKLAEKVAKDLGCSGKVKANLYKMLLYEKGGHFNKHRDTEKEKGMFGTLIIQLPSIYTGGELTVYGYGESKTSFDFGQSTGKAEYSIHYAAHYADLEHEVAEVKSGHRLVLIYNLSWADGNGTCLNNELLAERMKESLSVLNESPLPIAMILDHRYTEQALKTNGLKALKGIDNDRYNLLKRASDKLPLNKQSNFYLINAIMFINAEDTLAGCDGYRCGERPSSDDDSDYQGRRYGYFDDDEDEDEYDDSGDDTGFDDDKRNPNSYFKYDLKDNKPSSKPSLPQKVIQRADTSSSSCSSSDDSSDESETPRNGKKSCGKSCHCNSEDTDNEVRSKKSQKKEKIWETTDTDFDVCKFYDFSNKISAKDQAKIKKELELKAFVDIIDPHSKDFEAKIDLENRKIWGRHTNIDKSGPTGNEGATKTTVYEKYFLVFWPNMNEYKTLTMISHKFGLEKLLEMPSRDYATDPKFINDFKYLLITMKHANDRKTLFLDVVSDDTVKILNILYALKDLDLAKLFFGNICSFIYGKMHMPLVNCIKLFGYDRLRESLKSVLLPISGFRFGDNCKLVNVMNFFLIKFFK